jgi:hypothetical protein
MELAGEVARRKQKESMSGSATVRRSPTQNPSLEAGDES